MRKKIGRVRQLLIALVGTAIIWGTQGAGLILAQASAEQSLFHTYAKPIAAPDFSLENLQGKIVHLKDYRGKAILLNFWATWCPNCRQEAHSFNTLQAKYLSQGLEIYRINTKESRETILKFTEKNSIATPILLDKTGKVGRLFGVWAHPTSYLVDRRGMVRYRVVGQADWAGREALRVIHLLLGEK